MVFVMLGTQKEQFSRILDYVVNSKILKNTQVLIQNGHTKYENLNKNLNVKLLGFVNQDEFKKYVRDSDYIITHGGVGSIFAGLLNNKKVLAVPRLKIFDEHIDDHQIEICDKLQELDYILEYNEQKDGKGLFDEKLEILKNTNFKKYISDSSYLKILKNQI